MVNGLRTCDIPDNIYFADPYTGYPVPDPWKKLDMDRNRFDATIILR